ncbi:MAG: mechanosensitive ion channel family protein [Chloroflexota bacterium]
MNPYAPLLASAEQLVRGFLSQLPMIVGGLVAVALFLFLAVIVRRIVRSALRRYDRTLAAMVGQLAYAGTVTFGILVAFWIAIPTINFREIFAGLGVTGLILGFALKDLLENFAAGVLILWRRPFKLDDQIRSGSYEGTVVEINFRSTVLRTYDGLKVYIPNGQAFTQPLENLTGFPQRRSAVTLGIDQNASVGAARRVILHALREMEPAGVLPDPAPVVFFDNVGDFANELHVLYWTTPPNRFSELTTKSDVTERLYVALQDADIGFPYPIQTVQLRAENNSEQGDHQREMGGSAAEGRGMTPNRSRRVRDG